MKTESLDVASINITSRESQFTDKNNHRQTKDIAPSTTSNDAPILYKAPFQWKADNRKRGFIPLSARQYSRETDWGTVRRSVDLFLRQQDERGSFYTDEDYRSGDRVDDQIGGAAALAYFLSQTVRNEKIVDALERAVRFHLDHLVCAPSPTRPFRYSRYFIDRDSSGDWCNTNWCICGGALTLQHGVPYLSKKTAAELRDVMLDNWSYISTFPTRDENPCHNQLLAYCDIGFLLAKATGNKAIFKEVLDYYHERLRRLRVYDRGHWIYSEFNQWDANYGVFAWSALENLFFATGDPAFAEDAEQMALYFNELVSAGGYIWGGSRREEGGLDEFIQAPTQWAFELGLDRLLLAEPAQLWQRLVMDGHYIKGVVHRMEVALRPRKTKRLLAPTPWHFQKGNASVCLQDDAKIHHVSSAGLEIIPVAGAGGIGSGLFWKNEDTWNCDFLHAHPPKASEGHRYNVSKPIELPDVSGLAAMQRGYLWETRQWWISTGQNLLWIGQLITHTFPQCDKIDFILGNPVLTRILGEAAPVTEVESAEGAKADTQGEAVTISSRKFLKFGDLVVGATAPLKFIRPARDAFHTFPVPGARLLREFASSNELRLVLSETPVQLECRESIFFAVELGKETPSLSCRREPLAWNLKTRFGEFDACQTNDIWNYTFATASGRRELPDIGFGFHTS